MSYLYVDTMLNKLWAEHFVPNNPNGFINNSLEPQVSPKRKRFLYGIPAILGRRLNDFPALLIPTIEWLSYMQGNGGFSLCICLNFNYKRLGTYLKIHIDSSGDILYEHSNYDSGKSIKYPNFIFENILHEDVVLRHAAWEAFQDYLCRYLQIPEQERV